MTTVAAASNALTPAQVQTLRNAMLAWLYTTVSQYTTLAQTTDAPDVSVAKIMQALGPHGAVDERDVRSFVSVVKAKTPMDTLFQKLTSAPSIQDALGEAWMGDPEHPSLPELAAVLIPDGPGHGQ